MLILAIADHESFTWAGPSRPADLVVSCGDVSDSLILGAAAACSATHVVAVKGNHDSAAPFPPPIAGQNLPSSTHHSGAACGYISEGKVAPALPGKGRR